MNISEFINKLEQIKKERGDLNVAFSIQDAYSPYGVRGQHPLGKNFWHGIQTNNEELKLSVYLDKRTDGEVEKYAKITFRK